MGCLFNKKSVHFRKNDTHEIFFLKFNKFIDKKLLNNIINL
jgi:hypothetical protein